MNGLRRALLLVVLFALTTSVWAKQPCSIRTISGVYVFELTGALFQGQATKMSGTLVPGYLVGKMTITPDGKVNGEYWGLFGATKADSPWAADVTVNPDCSGTYKYGSGINPPTDTDYVIEYFVILNNGEEIRSVTSQTKGRNAGFVWETTAHRIAPLHRNQPYCSQHSLTGEYVMRCEQGFEFLPRNGEVAYINAARVLKVNFDRDGSFEGGGEGNMGGTYLQLTFTGTRIVNPDCTVEATFIPGAGAGLPPGTEYKYRGVLYDNGAEGWLVPTALITPGGPFPVVGAKCQITRMQGQNLWRAHRESPDQE